MLCLTRQEGQRIIVGDKLVIIEVTRIKGGVVGLGITAPPELTVHREEVYLAIAAEKESEVAE